MADAVSIHDTLGREEQNSSHPTCYTDPYTWPELSYTTRSLFLFSSTVLDRDEREAQPRGEWGGRTKKWSFSSLFPILVIFIYDSGIPAMVQVRWPAKQAFRIDKCGYSLSFRILTARELGRAKKYGRGGGRRRRGKGNLLLLLPPAFAGYRCGGLDPPPWWRAHRVRWGRLPGWRLLPDSTPYAHPWAHLHVVELCISERNIAQHLSMNTFNVFRW